MSSEQIYISFQSCKDLFETLCITSESHINHAKLCVFSYITIVQRLYMSSEYIYISFQSCKAFFETPCTTSGSRIEL
jgi:hypothetical protein